MEPMSEPVAAPVAEPVEQPAPEPAPTDIGQLSLGVDGDLPVNGRLMAAPGLTGEMVTEGTTLLRGDPQQEASHPWHDIRAEQMGLIPRATGHAGGGLLDQIMADLSDTGEMAVNPLAVEQADKMVAAFPDADKVYGTSSKFTGRMMRMPGGKFDVWTDLAKGLKDIGKTDDPKSAEDGIGSEFTDRTKFWLAGLGERLVAEVGEHERGAAGYGTQGDAAYSATVFELSRMYGSVRDGKLSGVQGERVASLFGKLRAGDNLSEEEYGELADGIVKHAKLTEAWVHPEMSIHPLISVAEVNMDTNATALKVLPFTARKWEDMDSAEQGNRLNAIAAHNPDWFVETTAENFERFVQDHVDESTLLKGQGSGKSGRREVALGLAHVEKGWAASANKQIKQGIEVAAARLSEEYGKEVTAENLVGAVSVAFEKLDGVDVFSRRVIDGVSGMPNPSQVVPRPQAIDGWTNTRLTLGDSVTATDRPAGWHDFSKSTDVGYKLDMNPDGTFGMRGNGQVPRNAHRTRLKDNGGDTLLAPWRPQPLTRPVREQYEKYQKTVLQDPASLEGTGFVGVNGSLLNGPLPERIAEGAAAIMVSVPFKTAGGRQAPGAVLKQLGNIMQAAGLDFDDEELDPHEALIAVEGEDGIEMQSEARQYVTFYPTDMDTLGRMVAELERETEDGETTLASVSGDHQEVVVFGSPDATVKDGWQDATLMSYTDGARSMHTLAGKDAPAAANAMRVQVPSAAPIAAVPRDSNLMEWEDIGQGAHRLNGVAEVQSSGELTYHTTEGGVASAKVEGEPVDQVAIHFGSFMGAAPQVLLGSSGSPIEVEQSADNGVVVLRKSGSGWEMDEWADNEIVPWLVDEVDQVVERLGMSAPKIKRGA